MKRRSAIVAADIFIFFLNDLLAWSTVIAFDITDRDCKFQNPAIHRLIFAAGILHITASILCIVYFSKKERTRYRIQAGSKLFIYNVIMTLFPYMHLTFTRMLA